jgi:hypothetical protein
MRLCDPEYCALKDSLRERTTQNGNRFQPFERQFQLGRANFEACRAPSDIRRAFADSIGASEGIKGTFADLTGTVAFVSVK